MTESAVTPFEKALGLASLEHIFIQAGQTELAEKYAKRIPATDSSSSLAKAEALSAAAAAWLRARNTERAEINFDSAKQIVVGVSNLPLGRIAVLVSIASAQFKGGMTAAGVATLRVAIELTRKMPLRPPSPPPGVRHLPTPLGVHYQDEAFGRILRAAIHARALQIAEDTAEMWGRTDKKAGAEVVGAWLAEGRTDEAIAAARRIEDPEGRVSELLNLASSLLSEAGAPIF